MKLKQLKPFGNERIWKVLYQADPGPVNCATHSVTSEILRQPHHPLHQRVARRLASFDNKKLHIVVTAPHSLSKSAYIRDYFKKRARSLLFESLRKHGWNWDGTARAVGAENMAGGQTYNLMGAYRIMLLNLPIVFTSSADKVRYECDQLVKRMAEDSRPRKFSSIVAGLRGSHRRRDERGR